MAHKISASSLFIVTGCLLALLLGGCAVPYSANAASQSLLPTASSQNTQVAAVTTSCPAPGKGRAAVLPSFTHGTHTTLVYTFNQFDIRGIPLSSTLKRYDTLTRSKAVILSIMERAIQMVQVSANGQWVLFQTQGSHQTRLELVRMDGRYHQTLYCSTATMNALQWSTNQKLIAFSLYSGSGSAQKEAIDLLNTSSGAVQTDLSVALTSQSNALNLRTWLDNTRIYLTNSQIDQPPNIIYLLDTRKGPSQQVGNLQVVFSGSFSDFDSSYDTTRLFINACACGLGGFTGPSTISVRPATGGSAQTLYSTVRYAITSVRAVTATTLLFTIDTFARLGQADGSHNGLWKIQTNGKGLTRLTTDKQGVTSAFNSSTQFPWSNVSRDGALYSLLLHANTTQSIHIGPLAGGTPTAIASFSGNGAALDVAGWTTM